MEEIKQIIAKVRQMYKFDTVLKDIITRPASVRVSEHDGELAIEGIIFNWMVMDDNVTVTPTAIRHFKRDENKWETLITYKDFNELMGM